MTEPRRYVVACACTGQVQPLAWLDDDRAVGGELTVRAAHGSAQVIFGHRVTDELPAPDHQAVATAWTDNLVSETYWDSGRLNWTIVCVGCRKQAQLSEKSLADIADELAGGRDAMPAVPTPDPDDPSVIEQRHMIQLGALCRRLARNKR